MYATVLFLHSWLRWIVVGLGIVAFVSAWRARASKREFTRTDDRIGLLFVIALDVQVTLGLAMYLFLSPITRIAFQDPGAAMHSSVLRFFLIEHVLSMTLALVAAHVGRIRTRRVTTSPEKHQRAASGVLIAFLCILVGIPWPFLPYARPLARMSATAEGTDAANTVAAQTKEVFSSRCGPCHGVTGRGDGPAAVNLLPKPRDFHDPSWQRNVSDSDIENIIRRGGVGVGKSMLMPANPDFDDEQIRELRLHVRSLAAR
jgi:mono/diheme cytochrome c family protein